MFATGVGWGGVPHPGRARSFGLESVVTGRSLQACFTLLSDFGAGNRRVHHLLLNLTEYIVKNSEEICSHTESSLPRARTRSGDKQSWPAKPNPGKHLIHTSCARTPILQLSAPSK
jgi:hypothetical protein